MSKDKQEREPDFDGRMYGLLLVMKKIADEMKDPNYKRFELKSFPNILELTVTYGTISQDTIDFNVYRYEFRNDEWHERPH
ncbi:hypothetical protein HYV88_01280 [Candidatus Woesearchaeota archaeon]|nr:hypothetical protein [Candidatus Woesearchaeota archaeon]